MRSLVVTALICAALAESGCTYGEERLPDCWTENVGPSVKALSQLPSLGGPETTIQHTLCSTHADRLAQAETALTSVGFSHDRHRAEIGECLDVDVHGQISPSTIKKQVENICTIAAAARVAYSDWSGDIGGRFVFVHGNYVSVSDPDPK
jgi:hypothetical protein